jgi:hypothetical protein
MWFHFATTDHVNPASIFPQPIALISSDEHNLATTKPTKKFQVLKHFHSQNVT